MGIINWENESRDGTLGAACPTNSGIIQKTTENLHMKGDYETHLVPHQRRISSLEFLVFIVKNYHQSQGFPKKWHICYKSLDKDINPIRFFFPSSYLRSLNYTALAAIPVPSLQCCFALLLCVSLSWFAYTSQDRLQVAERACHRILQNTYKSKTNNYVTCINNNNNNN